MIKAQDLTKRYRKKIAVEHLSFEVETGRVTGFLGPNGAGKSTTMRLMLGLDNGGGSTTFDGKKLHEYAKPSQMVGILLEAKAFHPTRTARQHLRVLADAGGVNAKRVDEVLEEVGLTGVAKNKPGKFSLGMSQRLGIAAAILGKPKYLVLDEPANGLDPEGIAWLRDFLKQYADSGNAVFVSSHLLSEMAQMADDVVVIGKGKLITAAPIKELLSKNGHSGVFVRSPKLAQMQKILEKQAASLTKEANGIKITGLTSDQIGMLAFENGLPLLELSPQAASLEEAFLELTAGSQEFAGKAENKEGKR
jgi:ABC-2 type transport system ATP-binding protein